MKFEIEETSDVIERDKLMVCPFCDNQEHIASATIDSDGNIIGWFCHNARRMIEVNTTYWSGEDLFPRIDHFTRSSAHLNVLPHLTDEKLYRLSKWFAYKFLQTEYARLRSLNYYFIQRHVEVVLTRLRAEVSEETEADHDA